MENGFAVSTASGNGFFPDNQQKKSFFPDNQIHEGTDKNQTKPGKRETLDAPTQILLLLHYYAWIDMSNAALAINGGPINPRNPG